MITEEWTSADQMSFFANKEERETRPSVQPKVNWPGTSAGQGTSHTNRWFGRNN